MKFFLFRFVVALAIFCGIWYLPWVYVNVAGPFTTGVSQIAGGLLSLVGADVSVHSNILSIPGFSVQIRGICNGAEATFVLWSALLAFPAGWKYRLKGLLIGTLAIHIANTLRIISLLYLGAFNMAWFRFAHLYLWEILIMLDILFVFLVWLRLMPQPESYEAAA